MKIKLLTLISFVFTLNLSAQINKEDSTVQTIAYWDLREKQEYTITYEKAKVRENDTISKEVSTYDVGITVIDSTANSYIMEWHYKNHTTDQKELIYQELAKATDGLKIRFKTDEMGEFQEVLNLNEIQDYVKKSVDEIKKSYDKVSKETNPIFENLTNMFTSKEAIEAIVLRDIQAFHTFHGGQYALGEVIESQIEIENHFGGKPFLADITLFLDEIYFEEYNYVLKYYQTLNEEQVKEAVKSFLDKVGKNINSEKKDLDFDKLGLNDVQHESYIGSVIHDSGWVLYTLYTRSFVSEGNTHIETLIIEMK